ncbi:hypothetical protein MHB43_09190 [Paenibacillus sp. FSL H8-0317]|uniref:hypothetical protein n=1 Tax=unclassified Paenibacillus TaxID=185978 RepID=UPI001C97F7FC|nr:hypothetical protein [Paenibacillus sp. DR312]QZN77363.1 hypothetical protein K5K90_09275 [Paenibacillus sp. DR312]
MSGNSRWSIVGKIATLIYPLLISLICMFFALRYGLTYKLPNFDKVLDGAITFSSIVVGFLGALLGILISIKDSEIVDKIFRSKEKQTIKFLFYEPFILGLLVVVTSALMHVMRAYENFSSEITFLVWFFVTVWFVPSTFRVVNTFMSVFFVSNNTSSRPSGNIETDSVARQQRRDRLRRDNNSSNDIN